MLLLREPVTLTGALSGRVFRKRLPGTLGSDFSRTTGRPHPMEIHVLPGQLRAAEPDLRPRGPIVTAISKASSRSPSPQPDGRSAGAIEQPPQMEVRQQIFGISPNQRRESWQRGSVAGLELAERGSIFCRGRDHRIDRAIVARASAKPRSGRAKRDRRSAAPERRLRRSQQRR